MPEVDLAEVVPEPPAELLSWSALAARARRRRARRAIASIAAVVVLVSGVVVGATTVGHRGRARPPATFNPKSRPLLTVAQRRLPHDHVRSTIDATDVASDTTTAVAVFPGEIDHLAVSPDNHHIAFTGQVVSSARVRTHRALYLVDGAHARELAQCQYICDQPEWSPDGTRIAFADDAIKIAQLDGRVRTVCGQRCGDAPSQPQWSPDGQWLVFSEHSVIGFTGYVAEFPQPLWVVRADGSDAHQLTQADCTATARQACGDDYWPVWSPDGKTIAFSRVSPQIPPGYSIHHPPRPPLRRRAAVLTVALDGNDLQQICRCSASNLAWSPDGERIAFLVVSHRPAVTVIDVDRDARRDAICPRRDAGFTGLVWSPDSTQLALAVEVDDSSHGGEIYTARVNDLRLVRLPVGQLPGDAPLAWAPAG